MLRQMRTRSFIPGLAGLFWLFLLGVSCNGNSTDEKLQKAYQFRLEGKVQKSLALLEELTANNDSDPRVWFELARTRHHYGLGHPADLLGGIDTLQGMVDKTLELDPQNVIYAFYRAYIYNLKSYLGMVQNSPQVPELLHATCDAYEQVLKLKPDYYEAELNLVELFSIPAEMGGDSSRAEMHARNLEAEDPIWGAKAREILLSRDSNRVAFWESKLAENPGQSAIEEQLGKAYLYHGEDSLGMAYLDRAFADDTSRKTILLDQARYYLLSVQHDTVKAKELLPKAEYSLDRFLGVESRAPFLAFANYTLGWLKSLQGDNSSADSLLQVASTLDDSYSRAFGIPPDLLFTAPTEIAHYHSYFFRPF